MVTELIHKHNKFATVICDPNAKEVSSYKWEEVTCKECIKKSRDKR